MIVQEQEDRHQHALRAGKINDSFQPAREGNEAGTVTKLNLDLDGITLEAVITPDLLSITPVSTQINRSDK